MPFHRAGDLRYYSFSTLDPYPLTQAIFTRQGGASVAQWESLNVGGTVGDNPDSVEGNIRKIFRNIGFDPHSNYDVWQVHSARVQVVESPRRDPEIPRADIMVTNNPQVTLFMRFADCVPIILYDPVGHAAGIVHAGWKGVIKNAPGAAVRAMVKSFGSNPSDLLAAIGPSICVDCYPIGIEVVEMVKGVFMNSKSNHLVELGDQVHFNLWSACQSLLQAEGVAQIEQASLCTATNLEDWYSHRGEKGKTGRFAALIRLSTR
jgi:YfiH family protein